MRIAVFPGSFDPITIGHVDIIQRGTEIFDKVVIAIGNNTTKQYLLSFEERVKLVKSVTFSGNVEVMGYSELTVEFCKKIDASYILRGLRSVSDFDYERSIAHMNKDLDSSIETVFLLSKAEYSGITSTIVREIMKYHGDISRFVPVEVIKGLNLG